MATTTPAQLRGFPPINQNPRGIFAPVTANSAPFALGTCIGLNVSGAGLATIRDVGGNDVQIYLQQGWNPAPCSQIATGAAATGIVAVY